MKVKIVVELTGLGLELQKLRCSKGWSLNETSQQLALKGYSLTGQNIHKIELGQIKVVPLPTLQMLCSILGLDLSERLTKLFS